MSSQFDGRVEQHRLRPIPDSEDALLDLNAAMMIHLDLPADCAGSDLLKATFLSNGILISRRDGSGKDIAPFERPVEILKS